MAAKRPKLKVEKRDVIGKKVKKLRKTGIFPANIYGKGIQSLSVQVPFKDFEKIFKEVGETGLLDIEINSEIRPILIKNVQFDVLTHTPLHADFFQVNLKEKVKAMVPIVTVGEPKAVTEKIGLLLQPLSEVEVEALPENLPENIEVNVEPLAVIDEQITISDLKVPSEITILTEPEQVVVKISELVSKEAEEQAAQEAAAAEAAKAESAEAGVQGVEPSEGEAEVKIEGEKPAEPTEKPAEAVEKPQE